MDFVDPKKQFRQRIMLFVGYILIAVAILIATTILLYEAKGYGFGKNGTVIQNGLIFLSSQPNPANIYLNGQPYKSTTNTRLFIPSGVYNVTLTKSGYRDWNRTISLNGGTVMHFDYPILFPKQLKSTKVTAYSDPPPLVTQSPDRRWLLVEKPGSAGNFELFDLSGTKPKMTEFSLPSTIVSQATSTSSWQLEEWADDNDHVVLQHVFDGKLEYILVDTQNPSQSINLNNTLNANPSKLTLNNKKYNSYYLYNAGDQSVSTASLSAPTPVAYLTHVLAYQSYGSSTMLYVTGDDAPPGKVLLKLVVGNQTYVLHSFTAGTNYVLNLTTYSGTLYAVAGATSENKVYVFEDPVGQLNANPEHAVVPVQVLHVPAPNYVSFSDNAQFIMAENGTQFGVYDLENKLGYNYSSLKPLDAPQTHASWMDGDRLMYVSDNKLLVFDYDHANAQTLISQNPSYLADFNTDYTYLYGMEQSSPDGQFELTQTSMLTPVDQ